MSQLASLSESARTVALNRYRILQPHLEQERFLTRVAHDAGIPYRMADCISFFLGMKVVHLGRTPSLKYWGFTAPQP
jgi:hypothetical protein